MTCVEVAEGALSLICTEYKLKNSMGHELYIFFPFSFLPSAAPNSPIWCLEHWPTAWLCSHLSLGAEEAPGAFTYRGCGSNVPAAGQ